MRSIKGLCRGSGDARSVLAYTPIGAQFLASSSAIRLVRGGAIPWETTMFDAADGIAGFDRELLVAMRAEARRQEEHIELFASENYTSPRVLEAQGSLLTNKYAEG